MYSTITNKEGNSNMKNLNFIHPIPKHEMFWNRVLSCCLIFSGGKINEENGTQRLINFRSGWVCWETTEPNLMNKTITAQSTRISICVCVLCVYVCMCMCSTILDVLKICMMRKFFYCTGADPGIFNSSFVPG